jgi:hypothetical protein
MAAKIAENTHDRSLWKTSRNEDQIILRSSLVSHIDWPGSSVDITYLVPGVRPSDDTDLLEADNLKENKKTVFKTSGLNQTFFDLWFSLYIKKEKPGPVTDRAADSTGMGPRQLQYEIFKMKPYEIQEQGFPEII